MDKHESLNALVMRLIIVRLQKAYVFRNRKQLHPRKGIRRTILNIIHNKSAKS